MRTVYSTCGMCLARCPIEVDVEGDRPVFIRGNRHSACKGALCPKGGAGLALHHDDERPRSPLIREGERGAGRFRAVSWDEALDYTAARIKSLMEEHGPQTLLWSERGGPYTDFNKAFLRALGTPNFCNHDSTCSHNVNEACFSLTGRGRHDFIHDYKNCLLMVFQARNPLESLVVKEVNDILDAREAGCRMVVFDVRASVSACKADVFLMPRPGTDYAVNLAVLNVLISENLHNRDYVAERVRGFEELARFIEPYDPRWAAGETGLEAESIAALAREAAAAAPAVIWHPGWMTSRYAQSGMVSRSAYMINALLGSIGARGGLRLAAGPADAGNKGLKAFSDLFPRPNMPRADGIGSDSDLKHLSSGGSLIHRALASLRDDNPYPLRAYIAYRHDPLSSLPDPAAQKKLLEKIELLVSVTFSWSDTAFYSDVVLPMPMYLESDSLIGVKPGLKPQFFVRRRATAPRFDTMEGWRIISALAARLGAPELAFERIEDVWARQLEGTGLSIDDFAARGFVDLCDSPLDKEVFPLPNASGRVEFTPGGGANGGCGVLEPYRAPAVAPEGGLRLTVGRSALHTHAHTQNNPMLAAKMPENPLWIHPAPAAALGVADGDLVSVSAENGASCRARAMVTPAVRPEAVYMVHGFGHRLPVESRSFGRGAADQELMAGGLEREDSFGRAIALQEHFVQVRPLRGEGLTTARAMEAGADAAEFETAFFDAAGRAAGQGGGEIAGSARPVLLNEARCINCKACEVHCQNKNGAPPELRLGLHIAAGPLMAGGRFALRAAFVNCRHCAAAPCLAACPTGAMRRDGLGFVYVEKDFCQGCEACRKVCPWQAPQLDKARGVMLKCDGCRDLAARGLPPACVAGCAARALSNPIRGSAPP